MASLWVPIEYFSLVLAAPEAEQQHAFESRREISLRRSVGTVLAGFPTRHFALFSVGSPFVSRTFIIKDAMCVLRFLFSLSEPSSPLQWYPCLGTSKLDDRGSGF